MPPVIIELTITTSPSDAAQLFGGMLLRLNGLFPQGAELGKSPNPDAIDDSQLASIVALANRVQALENTTNEGNEPLATRVAELEARVAQVEAREIPAAVAWLANTLHPASQLSERERVERAHAAYEGEQVAPPNHGEESQVR